ncbi:MAG TPA: cytochrome c biogenesis heme-transporting ATPase CcmA [Gallionellaceae bacterium]
MLEVSNLACRRGDHQLFEGLGFTLSEGELMQVLGANGSGKTTLLRTLCGFMQPAAGNIKWAGQNVGELGESYFAQIVYLGHANAIKDELSALENVLINASLAGNVVDPLQAIAALRRLGLRGKENLPVKVLSQGQRRRIALARLLLSNAPLWILDEPLAALDVSAVGLMQALIGEHLSRQGMAIFTTHQPLEVAGVTTRQVALS